MRDAKGTRPTAEDVERSRTRRGPILRARSWHGVLVCAGLLLPAGCGEESPGGLPPATGYGSILRVQGTLDETAEALRTALVQLGAQRIGSVTDTATARFECVVDEVVYGMTLRAEDAGSRREDVVQVHVVVDRLGMPEVRARTAALVRALEEAGRRILDDGGD